MALTTGAVERLLLGPELPPTPLWLQVLDVREIAARGRPANASPKRFRLQVSDGIHSCTLVLASQCGQDGQLALSQGTVLRVDEVIANAVMGHRVIIVLEAEAVSHSNVIGSPRPLSCTSPDATGTSGSATQQELTLRPMPSLMLPSRLPEASSQPHLDVTLRIAYAPGGLNATQEQLRSGAPAEEFSTPEQRGTPRLVPTTATAATGTAINAARVQQATHDLGAHGNSEWPWGPVATDSIRGPSPPPAPNQPGQGPPAALQWAIVPAPVTPPLQRQGLGAAAGRSPLVGPIVPIRSLGPASGRWSIKGRCTAKAQMRRWSSVKGEGDIFSFDLLDGSGGEIRVTAFNEVAHELFPLIEMGSIYTVSRANLKNKNTAFNATDHPYEIVLNRGSVVERCADTVSQSSIPQMQTNFHPMAGLSEVTPGTMVNILGVVEEVAPWQVITKRDGGETHKRTAKLRDRSGSVELVLWGNHAHDPGDQLEAQIQRGDRPVVTLHSGRVADFNGVNVSTVSSTVLRVNPDIVEARALAAWHQGAGGGALEVTNVSHIHGGISGACGDLQRCTLSCIKGERLGHGRQPDWMTVPAMVLACREDVEDAEIMYPACGGDRLCAKRSLQDEEAWCCQNCGWRGPVPQWRYKLTLRLVDHSGSTWAHALGDVGKALFGLTATELYQLFCTRPLEYRGVVKAIFGKAFLFVLKVHEDEFLQDRQVRVHATRIEDLQYPLECKVTLELIQKLEAGEPVLHHRLRLGCHPYTAAHSTALALPAAHAAPTAGSNGGNGHAGLPLLSAATQPFW